MLHAVIVNYHRPDITQQAIDSVLSETDTEVRVVLIENDGDGVWAQERYANDSRVVVKANADNLGFGAGCNQGMEIALADGTDVALLLNNDAVVEQGALKPLVEAAMHYGLAAPKILLPQKPLLYAAGGILEMRRARCRNRGLRQDDRGQFDYPARFPFSSACALAVSRRALETGIRFYEPFFLYYEDADYCVALNRAGFEVAYVPQARVIHLESASTSAEGRPSMLYYNARNRWIFLRRQATFLERIQGSAYLIAVSIIRTVSFLVRGKAYFSHVAALWQGLRDGVLNRAGKKPER